VGGAYAGSLIVKVPAAPHEGAANEDVVSALASSFGVPVTCVRILQGRRSPRKVIELDIDEQKGTDILEGLLARPARP
jgi:uncharacterized protein YggU (UPF0235/DUF167 family)